MFEKTKVIHCNVIRLNSIAFEACIFVGIYLLCFFLLRKI